MIITKDFKQTRHLCFQVFCAFVYIGCQVAVFKTITMVFFSCHLTFVEEVPQKRDMHQTYISGATSLDLNFASGYFSLF